jgi:hypothetical protein
MFITSSSDAGASRPPTELAHMKPHGICKIPKGSVDEDSVWVKYENGDELDIRESQYRSRGYEPPFEELPVCNDIARCLKGAPGFSL